MRRSGTEEREAQLFAWDASLVQRQRQLQESTERFREEMKNEVHSAAALREALDARVGAVEQREKEVALREKAVAEAETTLLRAAAALRDRQAVFQQTMEKAVVDECRSLAADGPEGPVDGEPQGAAASPNVLRTADIATTLGSANRHQVIASMSSDRTTPQQSTLARTESPGLVGSRGVTPVSRGISPQLYEGPVDPHLPSMVEDIDDEPTPHKPRGLRSSPQFQPMDPNDSGLDFLRPSRRAPSSDDNTDDEDHQEEEEEDEALQDQLDQAVLFLVSAGIASVEEIQGWLNNGVTAHHIIELSQREAARRDEEEEEGADGGDEDQYGYDDEDGQMYEDYEEDDEAEDRFRSQSGEGNTSEETGGGQPITVDEGREVLEDGEASSKEAGHNDSLTTGRVRGSSASQTPRRHNYDSFDDDSDDNAF